MGLTKKQLAGEQTLPKPLSLPGMMSAPVSATQDNEDDFWSSVLMDDTAPLGLGFVGFVADTQDVSGDDGI